MALLTASFIGVFRWSSHWVRRRAAKKAVTYSGVEFFQGAHLALSSSASRPALLTSARTVGATLERRPLVTDVHAQKDWFRLLHKVACACISPRDVIKCSERQIELLLPLLLRVELVSGSLTARLTHSSRLRLRAHALLASARKPEKAVCESLRALLSYPPPTVSATFAWFGELIRGNRLEERKLLHCPKPYTRLVIDPLSRHDDSWRVQSVMVKKTFASGHGPSLLELDLRHVATRQRRTEMVLLKPDDVRPDLAVLEVFEVINFLWRHSYVAPKPCALTFSVVPGATDFGFMEFVQDAAPVRDTETRGAFVEMLSELGKVSREAERSFVRTLAGSLVSGHVVGIGDRHEDNMMRWHGHGSAAPLLYFQLDFKHVFGNRTKGVDAAPLTIPTRMKEALEDVGLWTELVELCVEAFRVLRRSHSTLQAVCLRAFDGVKGAASKDIEGWLARRAFFLGLTEEEACAEFRKHVETTAFAPTQWGKNFTHDLSMARKKKAPSGPQPAAGPSGSAMPEPQAQQSSPRDEMSPRVAEPILPSRYRSSPADRVEASVVHPPPLSNNHPCRRWLRRAGWGMNEWLVLTQKCLVWHSHLTPPARPIRRTGATGAWCISNMTTIRHI